MQLRYESIVQAPVPDVFAFYSDLNNLVRITPPGTKVEIVDVEGSMRAGTRIEMMLRQFPFRITWISRITEHEPNRYFVDVQEKGPFARWEHRHEFRAVEGGTLLIDEVDCQAPLYPLSWPVQAWIIKSKLDNMFEHRHSMTRTFLSRGNT